MGARKTIAVALAAAALTGGAIALLFGEDEAGGPGNRATPSAPAPGEGKLAPADEVLVRRAVRAYVKALDRRDGAAVCELLAPGAIEQVELPEERESCAASLGASIGYSDPRGYPVFGGIDLGHADVVSIEGGLARATAGIVTTFRGSREPSIEDDLVFLERRGGRWLIAKPSAALYRAIGAAEPPLEAFKPPAG